MMRMRQGIVALGLALCLIAALGCVAVTADDSRTGIIFTGDFESGEMAPYGDSRDYTVQKTQIVSDPVRAGERALMVTLDRVEHAEICNHRTDFWLRGMGQSLGLHEDCWYAVSIHIPEDWQPDTQAELWVQWVLGGSPAGEVGGPSLAIYVYGDSYRVRKRWGPGADQYRNIWLGDVLTDRGKWTDWVLHVRWSPGDDGLIELWRDGELAATDTGQNCVASDYAPYFKFGIYKWPWKQDAEAAPSAVTRRVIYFDEIRIADDRGSNEAVSPTRTPATRGQGDG